MGESSTTLKSMASMQPLEDELVIVLMSSLLGPTRERTYLGPGQELATEVSILFPESGPIPCKSIVVFEHSQVHLFKTQWGLV